MNRSILLILIGFLSFLFAVSAIADYREHPGAKVVIERLVTQHGFTEAEVMRVLAVAQQEPKILDSMANAAEKTKTWTAYQKGFLSEWRISKGVEFLNRHSTIFDQVEKEYGVSRFIITAILGVETNYGSYTGKANVLHALATLAFDHPRRQRFFSSELVEYIVLCRERGWQVDQQLGSYAGAMGFSQFMPSNYRKLAVDGNDDGQIDLHTPADAIFSIANYFVHHGWRSGAEVASRVAVEKNFNAAKVSSGLAPEYTVEELADAGFHPQQVAEKNTKALVIRFKDSDGDDFWFGYHNFYVISRYNPRSKYAMAVYLLSEQIERNYAKTALAANSAVNGGAE